MERIDGARVLAAIDEVSATELPPAAFSTFVDFVGTYGFTDVHISQLVNPLNVPKGSILLMSNWPNEMLARRAKDYLVVHDPIARCALRSKRPFRWSESERVATALGKQLLAIASDYDINEGYMFPMHALDSITGGVSVGGAAMDVNPREVTEIELVAQHTYYHLENLMGPFPYQQAAELTPRETQVVQFAAAGKTNWEIAQILGVSQDTVKEALSRASERLDTVNRAHTVATAIASSQIFA